MSVDKYFGREYSYTKYNCFHFATDVWQDLTGVNIQQKFDQLLQGASKDRSLARDHVQVFRDIGDPTDPCLVLMQKKWQVPHIGVWIRGRVLHITEQEGVRHVPLFLATIGIDKTRFILPC